MTATILRHPNSEQEPISVHVVPLDIDDDRAVALMERYVEAVEAGEHPPYWYIGKVFSEIYAIGVARRPEGGA